jgi:hypothetical protein
MAMGGDIEEEVILKRKPERDDMLERNILLRKGYTCEGYFRNSKNTFRKYTFFLLNLIKNV